MFSALPLPSAGFPLLTWCLSWLRPSRLQWILSVSRAKKAAAPPADDARFCRLKGSCSCCIMYSCRVHLERQRPAGPTAETEVPTFVDGDRDWDIRVQ